VFDFKDEIFMSPKDINFANRMIELKIFEKGYFSSSEIALANISLEPLKG
jgi:hypothetical protein